MKCGPALRALACALAAASFALLTACGGGGSDGAPPAAPSTAPGAAQNVQPLVVDAGPIGASGSPTGGVNTAYISVTVCQPGSTAQCRTVDHVEVDTGSSGLRLLASALPPALALALPAVNDANANPLAECAQFVIGYTWGSVKQADIHIAGETAAAVPVQVIGDSALPATPASCSNGLAPQATVDALGANGVLGISVFKQDCGQACAAQAIVGTYYSCPGGACQPTAVGVSYQVANPVAAFAADNNGSILALPAIGASGAASASGSLVFGIGTQSNNGLGAAHVLTLDAASGTFTTAFNGQSYPYSYIDSGSNGLFFPDPGIAQCSSAVAPGFYCPASTLSLSAANTGPSGGGSTVAFSVANAEALLDANPGFTAFDDLAGTSDASTGLLYGFAWGLPFFYGRAVYTAIEGMLAAGTQGPYVAY